MRRPRTLESTFWISVLAAFGVLASTLAAAPAAATSKTAHDGLAVSPGGHEDALSLEARCPTFSWGKVEGARAYELVVFQVGRRSGRPVLSRHLPGAARSWTPSLGSCFAAERTHAWSIRALLGGGRVSAWARPLYFKPLPAPPGTAGRGGPTEIPEARRMEPSNGVDALPHPSSHRLSPGTMEPSTDGLPSEPTTPISPPLQALGAATVVISDSGITIDGQSVVTVSTDADVLAALSCNPGQWAVSNGSGWECGTP